MIGLTSHFNDYKRGDKSCGKLIGAIIGSFIGNFLLGYWYCYESVRPNHEHKEEMVKLSYAFLVFVEIVRVQFDF
jgi:hypothetical protein